MYDRSQKGWVLYSIFSTLLIFLFFAYLNQWGNNPIPLWPFVGVVALLLFIFLLFFKLRIVIKNGQIKVIYGIGLIRIKLKPDSIESVEVVETPWWYGLGIRYTPKGMLYNIHGSKAIRIYFIEAGKPRQVMLGTPEPEQLKMFITDHFSKNA